MKTINSASQNIQKSSSIKFIDKIILYKQFEGMITEIISSNSIKISGDATSFFNNSDVILCPLKDFETELTISTPPSYIAPDTLLSFNSGLFDSSDIGKTISLKIDISNKLIEDGIDKIQSGIEGSQLNEFDSGYLDVTVDNSDKYFLSSSNVGLFDNNYIFWLKYIVKFKGSNDNNLIYFGGLVDLTDFNPDFFNKTITIRAYGHSYELKRYAAYNVMKENESNLINISGVEIVSFTESNDREPGVKNIYYKPFNNSKLDGVSVTRVSADTLSGIKILEFKYPYFFKWNNGEWYKVAVISDTDNGSGELKMYETGGSGDNGYAIVKFGNDNGLNEYPDLDTELWVSVKDELTQDGTKEISNQGTPSIKFDNGAEEIILLHFQRVLKYIKSTNTYTDESDVINTPETNFTDVDIFQTDKDEIILISSKRFWGFDIILSDTFSDSDIDFQYSTGGLTWSAIIDSSVNGLVDNTDGMKKSGKVTWDDLKGWAVNDIVIGTDIDYKGYMIKITRNSASGNCSVGEIKRITRLIGKNNDFLEVNFIQSLLLPKELKDEIILKYDSGKWIFGTWYDNLSLQFLLEQALNKSHYGSNKRILSELKINKTDYSLNIWGKPPKYNYLKNPTAFDVDWDNDMVYAAVGLEIWQCTFQGQWKKLSTAKFWSSNNPESSYEIKKIWVSAFYIYTYTVREYEQQIHTGYLDRFNKTTGIQENLAGKNSLYDCRVCQRDGTGYKGTSNYYRQIGQFGTTDGGDLGENICIPYKQNIWVFDKPSNYALYPAPNLSDEVSGFPEWYFDNYYHATIADNSGPKYKSNMGFFGLHSNSGSIDSKGKAGFNWSFGQQGCEIFDKESNKLFLFEYKQDKNNTPRVELIDFETDELIRAIYYHEPDLPNCNCWDKINDILYFGFTLWHDKGIDSVSYSYISRYAKSGNRIVNAAEIKHYDHTNLVYTDITSLANGDGNLSSYVINEVDDAFYIGHTKKFRNIGFDLNNKSNDYVFEYWDGNDWTALEHTNESSISDGTITFHVPYDWATTGTYWYIRIRCVTFIAPDYLNNVGLYEEIIWDSELNNNGSYSKYMPIWMSYDIVNNAIHGTMFNRDPLSTANPFQWVYFVFDLNDNTCHFQNTGSNYTFDGTYLMKDFVYDEYNNVVHFMAENIRYQDKAGYLVKCEYSNTPNNPYLITLTKETVPRETEWGSQSNLVCNSANGNIFGLTKGNDKIIWEYSKSFYPRIELAKFNESDSIYEILKYIAQIMNCYYIVYSERNIKFLLRNEYGDDLNLIWNENMVDKKPKPGYWKHKYDSVSVDFRNPFNDEYQGSRKKGYNGWNRTQLRISNPLIQNSSLANYVSENGYNFFNKLRIEIDKISIIPLIQAECFDRVNITIPNKILEIDSNKYFIVTNIILDSSKNMNIKILEIK